MSKIETALGQIEAKTNPIIEEALRLLDRCERLKKIKCLHRKRLKYNQVK